MLEYYSAITFHNGVTIEKGIGTTEFVHSPQSPIPTPNAPQTFVVPVDTTELSRHETDDVRPSCDVGGTIQFDAAFAFPTGTAVTEG